MEGMSEEMAHGREAAGPENAGAEPAGPMPCVSAAMGAMMSMMAASSAASVSASEASEPAVAANEEELSMLSKRLMSGDRSVIEPYKIVRRRAFEFELEREIAMLVNPKVGGALADLMAKLKGDKPAPALAPHEQVD
jgi:hypothetical protein